MPKISKIDVLTVRLTCHIPFDPGNMGSLRDATTAAESLRTAGEACGQTTMVARSNRVSTPAPTGDGLDIPPALVRTGTGDVT